MGRRVGPVASKHRAEWLAATTRVAGDGVFDPLFGGVEERYQGAGPKVALLGDSIGVAACADLRHLLAGHATKFAAIIGEGVSGGPISHLAGSGDMLEVATRYGQDPPDVGIVELGTNDVWRPELSSHHACLVLPDVVAALSARRLVVVLVAPGDGVAGFDAAEARAINDLLEALADEVVDWPAIAARRGALKADGIHPTPQGANVLAVAIAAAIHRCARDLH